MYTIRVAHFLAGKQETGNFLQENGIFPGRPGNFVVLSKLAKISEVNEASHRNSFISRCIFNWIYIHKRISDFGIYKRSPDVLMSWSPDVLMSWCPEVLMSWCPGVLINIDCSLYIYKRSPDVLMSWSPDVLKSWCPEVLMSWSPVVLNFWCPEVLMSWSPDVLMSRCPD